MFICLSYLLVSEYLVLRKLVRMKTQAADWILIIWWDRMGISLKNSEAKLNFRNRQTKENKTKTAFTMVAYLICFGLRKEGNVVVCLSTDWTSLCGGAGLGDISSHDVVEVLRIPLVI